MKLHISTPEKKFPLIESDEITLPTENGEIVILPGHARLVSKLGTGTLSYRHGSHHKQISISRGVVEVKEEQVTVLADEASA